MSAGRTVNSLSQHWCTPEKYINAIKQMFNENIDLDPCSNKYSIVNAKTEYMLPNKNGLLESWNYKTIYVNPPYGADRTRGTTIKNWLQKCSEAHKMYGSEVLALIPVATNTTHWKYYIFGEASSICFLYDTRLKFIINGDDDNDEPRPEGTGYRRSPDELHSGFNTTLSKVLPDSERPKGRGINPLGTNKGAPMACCMVYWGNNISKFQSIFLQYGAVINIENLKGKSICKNNENLLFQEDYQEEYCRAILRLTHD